MMLHKCPGCGVIIPMGIKRCPACEKQYGSRHMRYNTMRRDRQAEAFYNSPAWRRKSHETIAKYGGFDIYELFVMHRVVKAEMVHHIIELSECWEKRFDDGNLIPLSDHTHALITKVYKNTMMKKQMQEKLREALTEYKKMAGLRGETMNGD